MLERFTSRGVTADRVRLHPRIASDASHLALYGEIDIAVDTFPYCGVTTTCEALWMGVPVVTLAGDTFVSRTGASLLQAVDHPEWIATDEDGYIERVCTLAADTAGRARLRSSLRDRMRSSPLMDEAGVTREVEDAYRAVWERHGPADRRIRPDSAAALIG
jgi:predicted O-linked N-acetylglucosamine transferase (SPINDLY family)